jgi:PTS system nitrogen regulatory IIA component
VNVGGEMMDLQGLAAYLRRDIREVDKLVSRGNVPGQKVRGQWRFARAEINHWIETNLPAFSEQQLVNLESARMASHDEEPLIAGLLAQDSIALPLAASTRASVLKGLVQLAEQTWQVYDPVAVLDAIRQREELLSTALPGGVAIPHPRRPLSDAVLGDSLIAFARTTTGIPFGAPRGGLTDLFFLVLCRDDRTHLRVLARLTRLLLRPEFLDGLRQVETPAEARNLIAAAEQDLGQDSSR